jgi:division protein CdvB (Snf7/Vps24/ESCRT-III family)
LTDVFHDRWKDREDKSSIASKIRNIGKPSHGLKHQIGVVTQRIEVQTRALDNAIKRFGARDADIFMRTAKALSQRDMLRANLLASELAEIRKVEKMLMHAQLALESVSLRLITVSELGDLVTVLAPAASVLGSIRSGMATVFPEANHELSSIGDLLSDIVSSTNQNATLPVNVGNVHAEAEKILQEAELAAEKKLRAQLPDVDAAISSKRRTSLEA